MNTILRISLLGLAIIIGIIVIIFFFKPSPKKATTAVVPPTNQTQPTIEPSTSPQPIECQPKQLKALISPEGAAGSITAKMSLTNITTTPCQITLGNIITAKLGATNIELHFQQKR